MLNCYEDSINVHQQVNIPIETRSLYLRRAGKLSLDLDGLGGFKISPFLQEPCTAHKIQS